MKSERESFPLLKFVLYLAVASIAITVGVIGDDAIVAREQFPLNNMPAITGETQASIERLVATQPPHSIDDTLRDVACTNLHTMLVEGKWVYRGRNKRVLVGSLTYQPHVQQHIMADADRWGCPYE